MSKINRRDFLKLGALFSAGAMLSQLPTAQPNYIQALKDGKNIIVLLFDAMSARNLSLYGYERETTPNLARLAQRSTVYHAHSSAGNFTSPGTASTLTGMYPWKHRAFNLGGMIKRTLADQNIFRFLGPDYYKMAFGQNLWADTFLSQFDKDINDHIIPTIYNVNRDAMLMGRLKNDLPITWNTFSDFVLSLTLPSSLISGYVNAYESRRKMPYYRYGFADYPKGIPNMFPFANVSFLNETVFAGITSQIELMSKQSQPYFGYFHFYSPHEPYKVSKKYLKLFDDDYQPVDKKKHPFAEGLSYDNLLKKRTEYDQLITNVDEEFGKLLDFMEAKGILDNTYLVITSDHGQMFERGEHGHTTSLLYESVTKIPLIIASPGQTTRRDIHTPTSNVDLVPTLLHLAGRPIPDSIDGQVLPGLGGKTSPDRAVYSMVCYGNSAFLPLTLATISMHKGPYKLIHYLGYQKYNDVYELYHLKNDPEELKNLAKSNTVVFKQMKEELLSALDHANQPYRK